jgi:hypothetical protein
MDMLSQAEVDFNLDEYCAGKQQDLWCDRRSERTLDESKLKNPMHLPTQV